MNGIICTSGSSPRTRGTAAPSLRARRSCRFIPAHAGNRWKHRQLDGHITVHPRARGEQVRVNRPRARAAGSSPRTRGTGPGESAARPGRRFIPAHAGNRQSRPAPGRRGSVHPRARGEQSRIYRVRVLKSGSSPRTRGTVGHRAFGHLPHRFIPAHAGNSPPPPPASCRKSVHPRARGEQTGEHVGTDEPVGSSPRTRGTADPGAPAPCCRRFIPAHAGNSVLLRPCTKARSVHPRARGEQWVCASGGKVAGGSSPRTRGTDVIQQAADPFERFIPAHAGNRRRVVCIMPPPPVHPRARGEQPAEGRPWGASAGSSPRTRGTVSDPDCCDGYWRFIPAHAGNRRRRSARQPAAPVHPRARGEQVQWVDYPL